MLFFQLADIHDQEEGLFTRLSNYLKPCVRTKRRI